MGTSSEKEPGSSEDPKYEIHIAELVGGVGVDVQKEPRLDPSPIHCHLTLRTDNKRGAQTMKQN
jgi:hypothetical protein